ncbi:hypothetical protein CMI47_06530 [Candidatus Pacearchaeota archaeon]|nr:hypothetical protein [Candidatus Pacearchaeota archaeon]
MKRFGEFLLEAHIFTEKPSEGTFAGRTLIGSSGQAHIERFRKFCKDLGIDETDSFTVSEKTPLRTKVTELKIGDGEICYDIGNSKNVPVPAKGVVEFTTPHWWMAIEHDSKGIIHLVTTRTGVGSMFAKGAEGIKWNESNLETASLMGIYLSVDVIKNMLDIIGENDQFVKRKLLDTLDNEGDWKSKSVSTFRTVLDTDENDDKGISTADLTTMCMLAHGMSIFINEKVDLSTPVKFIHSNIGKYYKAEKVSDTIKSVKDNTADAIICNRDWSDDFAGVLRDAKGHEDGYCTAGSYKWYQVSLKKAFGKAQMGKVTSFLKVKFGLDSVDAVWSSVLDTAVTEAVNSGSDLDDLLIEGLFGDILSKGREVVKKFTDKIASVLKGFFRRVQGFVKKRKSQLEKRQKREMSNVIKDLGFSPDIFKTQSEAKEYSELSQKGKSLVNSVNKELNELYTKIKPLSWVHMDEPDELNSYVHGQWNEENMDAPYKLFANICAIRAMDNILFTSSSTEEKIHNVLINNLTEIYADMIFGKTELPLWKVYGTVDGTHPYEYIGTYEDWQQKKKEALSDAQSIVEEDVNLDMVALRANKNVYYYNIESAMLWDYTDDFEWSQNRMGTNQGGEKVSWVFEGTKIINSEKYKDNFKGISSD